MLTGFTRPLSRNAGRTQGSPLRSPGAWYGGICTDEGRGESRIRPFLSTKRFILVMVLMALLMVPSSFAQTEDVKQYLLMQEILKAFKNAMLFKPISEAKISVNLDSPFNLHGYFHIDKFIDDFTLKFSGYNTLDTEWVSIQLEEQFAVQSLALILKNKWSEKIVYYKLIFFLTKKDEEWKIYYLRGLKIKV